MNRARALKVVVLLVAALALAAAAYFFPILDWIATAQAKIETYGAWAPVLYVFLYIVFTLCLVPGSALTFTAGLLYGPATGTAITLSASTLAECASFLVARYVARERVAKPGRLRSSARWTARWRGRLENRHPHPSVARPYVLLNYARHRASASRPSPSAPSSAWSGDASPDQRRRGLMNRRGRGEDGGQRQRRPAAGLARPTLDEAFQEA